MVEFLTEKELSDRIRSVLSGANIRCAVAFIGAKAYDIFGLDRNSGIGPPKIICDVSMGATYAPELERMGAPNNKNLKFLDGLHAKIYISDTGAVVASANASSGGIGLDKPAKLIEAGTFYSCKEDLYFKTILWFNELFGKSKVVDGDALERARRNYNPPVGAAAPKASPNSKSLIDLVRSNSESFSGVGFIFASEEASKSEKREAKREATKEVDQAEFSTINLWPEENVYLGLSDEETREWPGLFFEFWMPNKALFIRPCEATYRFIEVGSVFYRVATKEIKQKVGLALPSMKACSQSDAGFARKVLAKYKGFRIFRSPRELIVEPG